MTTLDPITTSASVDNIPKLLVIDEKVAETTTTVALIESNADEPASSFEERTGRDQKHADEDVEEDYEAAERRMDDEDDEDEYDDENVQLEQEIVPTSEDHNEGFCVVDNRIACGHGGFSGDLEVPCARNTRPQTVTKKSELKILKEVCPEFLEGLEDGQSPKLCCNIRGLRELKRNYEMPKQMGLNRCPSCYYNFRRVFCNSACSPQQNKFLRVDKTLPVTVANHSLSMVQQLTYFMNKNFADGLYKSCKSKWFLNENESFSMSFFSCRHSRYFCWQISSRFDVWQAWSEKLQRRTMD